MKLSVPFTVLLLGLAAWSPPTGSAAARECGTLASSGLRFPVRVLEGEVGCADAKATLKAYLDTAEAPEGFTCARGRFGDDYAAQCADDPSGTTVVQARNATELIIPATVKRGARLDVTASGLKGGRYTATLVAEEQPAQGARCLAQVGRAARTRNGWVAITGRIPAKLRCYQGADGLLGSVPLTAGRYRVVLGAKVAPAAWSGDRTFLRRRLRVR